MAKRILQTDQADKLCGIPAPHPPKASSIVRRAASQLIEGLAPCALCHLELVKLLFWRGDASPLLQLFDLGVFHFI